MLAKGTILKQWVLGEKLGSGACSDVYVVSSTSGHGSSETFAMKISAVPPVAAGNKRKKKTHADRSADALYAEHLLYVNTLQGHPGIPSLPPSGAYGEDKGYRFLVLQRLGRTLEQVKASCGGSLPEKSVARLGLEILGILRHLHSRKLLFVDVKPENFMMERNQETQVYCVDFGIAERYLLVTGAHKPYKVGGVVGTPSFLSLNCHNGSTPSRRDDIEALLYVCLYLIRGDLPWQSAQSDADGARAKAATPLTDLCASFSDDWVAMINEVRACKFEDEPDYGFFEANLKRIAGSTALSGVYKWDGEPNTKRQKTAEIPKKAPTPLKKASAAPTEKSKKPSRGKKAETPVVVEIEDEPVEEIKPAAKSRAKTGPPKKDTKKESPKDTAQPSARRLAAATRAVGAAAAANAAATTARRTRSTAKAELE
ncbi:Aste57867_19460 [Aphanomyces stellatus]|uniref:Casein kinase I n=1 Tax=Aphanomyces stellatus TaxID=120398 RepID=A0A485LCS9_9STRA|nr:hypothetical protein As57867_019396 [Aphanomyces stellatus]VFT96172.1 Aste57867_19460 [Aphanomyces stellatus]